MAITHKVFTSRNNNLDQATYVGEAGRLFYAQTTATGHAPTLRYSDGSTPGGLPLSGGSLTFSGSIPPENPVDGNLWWNTVDGRLYIYYDLSWVDASPDIANTPTTALTDRLTSGTSALILSSDGTVTFGQPGSVIPGATMYQNAAPIVVNLVDQVLDTVVDYSTTTTDFISAGTYGNANDIYHPYAVFRLTTSPPIALFNGDIVAGPSVPVGSAIIYAGTGSFTTTIITDSDYTLLVNGALVIPPPDGVPITFARPVVQQSFAITTPANNSIGLVPGTGGTIIAHKDIIPFEVGTQNLGSALKRWKHLWMGAGTIYFEDEYLQADVALTARNGLLTILGAGGLDVGEFTLQDNTITIKSNSRDIVIGSTTATGYVNFNRPVKMTGISGNKVFEVTRDGLVSIYPKQSISVAESAFSIIGNAAGVQQPRTFTGTMLQLTGQNGISTRISIDSFGTGAYPNITGRAARGTVQTPTATKANDTLFRIAVQGWGDNQYVPSLGRINIEAAEDFTNATAGTRIVFQTTPTGTNVIQTSTVVDPSGVNFLDNATGGITFYDRTRQTTAFTGTVDVSNITNLGSDAVTSISIGVGLSGFGGPGTASLNNTGVLSAIGTVDQVKVNGSYTTSSNGNITLGLPQDIAPTSNVTFNDVNITGNLNLLSTTTILIPSTVEGTILYLGFTATTTSAIDGGGIQLGNTATGIHSILWNRANNYWDFGTTGIDVTTINATTATLQNIIVNDGAKFGYSNYALALPGALVQADALDNTFAEIIIQNHSTGTAASANLVAANNLSDGYTYAVTLGKASSAFASGGGPLNANDGYLGNNNGNLIINSSDSTSTIKLTVGFPGTVVATVSSNGLTVASTVTSARFYGPLTGAVTGDVTGNVSGNAGTVTNGIYSNQTYNNPVWLATLSGSKINSAVGTATTVINGVYTTDVGSVSNTMLAGGITNNKLTSSTITLNVTNGITVSQPSPSLGGSTTIGFNTATLVATAVSVVGGIGVSSITAGTGTAISTSTGAVTVWNTVVGSIYGSGNVRTMGSTQTVSIDYNTDSFIHIDNPPGDVTIAFSNYVAGRAVKVIVSNNNKHAINLGVLAGNSSIGSTQLAGNIQATGQAVIIDYISLDGTSNLNFAAVAWR